MRSFSSPSRTKNVYLEMAGRLHSSYYSMISNPPDGYKITSRDLYQHYGISGGRSRLRLVDQLSVRAAQLKIPIKLLRSLFGYVRPPPPNTDLVFTNGILDFRNERWIVAIEEALSSLMGLDVDEPFFHKVVEKRLAHQNCTAIIFFNDAARNSMLSVYDTSRFESKFRKVAPAVPLVGRKTDRKERNKIDILLLGSANFQFSFSFFLKGGHIALESFIRLRKEFDNISFTIRGEVPRRYLPLLKNDRSIHVVELLHPKEFDDLLWNADICVLPCMTSPWTSFLDAMNHELPIVTVNTNANAEYVQNGKWGIVCDAPPELKPIINNYYLPDRTTMNRIFYIWVNDYEKMVEGVTTGLRTLIEDESKRKEFGVRGRKNLESGGLFSIDRRNAQLKQIFDDALA